MRADSGSRKKRPEYPPFTIFQIAVSFSAATRSCHALSKSLFDITKRNDRPRKRVRQLKTCNTLPRILYSVRDEMKPSTQKMQTSDCNLALKRNGLFPKIGTSAGVLNIAGERPRLRLASSETLKIQKIEDTDFYSGAKLTLHSAGDFSLHLRKSEPYNISDGVESAHVRTLIPRRPRPPVWPAVSGYYRGPNACYLRRTSQPVHATSIK